MRIGIDCDDVMIDFQKGFVAVLHKLYGRPPLGTDPIDWDWSNCQVSKEEMAAAWKYTEGIHNFWAKLEPLESFDAMTIGLLRKVCAKHDVFFITNRYPTLGLSPTEQTKHWLGIHAGIMSPNVLIAKEKGPVATVLQLDAFIDDRPKNCIDVKLARPTAKVYLCDSSHNQPCDEAWMTTNGIEGRVKDLKTFLKIILKELF
jgi:hypothetical protein